MQTVTVAVRPGCHWNPFRSVRSAQIVILQCPFWGSFEPQLKLPYVGPLWLSVFASEVLAWFPDCLMVLGVFFRASVCPLGCGFPSSLMPLMPVLLPTLAGEPLRQVSGNRRSPAAHKPNCKSGLERHGPL